MPGVYLDFRVRVVETFRRMRDLNKISDRLKRPSPAKLREECIRIYKQRLAKKDEKILREFFEYEGEPDLLLRRIENFPADKFKPLRNFLVGDTGETEDKNIDLLAWLIGFEKRPYDDREDYTAARYSNYMPVTESPQDYESGTATYGQPNGGSSDPGKPGPSSRKRQALVLLLILAPILGLIVYQSRSWKPQQYGVNRDQGCMYWTGDHYEASPCIPRGGDTVMSLLDQNRLRNFRRITDTTLITPNSVGKVWYRIKSGEFEFYTAPGKHPVDNQISVRRLTKASYARFKKSPIQ